MSGSEDGSDRTRDFERDGLRATRSTTGGISLVRILSEWLTTYGERAGDVLIYSSAYMAVIAMVGTAIVMVLLELPPNLAPLVVGLLTFAVYANDRLVDLDADEITDPERANFVRRHRSTLYGFAALAYGLAVGLSTLGGPDAFVLTLLPGVFWVLYATEWIPDIGVSVRRLKEVLLLNSVVVAFAWAMTLTFLPIVFTDAPITPMVGSLFGYYFLGIFVNTEIQNVADMNGDEETGVVTMPIVFGVRTTRRILYLFTLLSGVPIVYAVFGGMLSWVLAVPLLVGVAYSLCVTAFLGRTENERVIAIAAELEHVLVGVLLAPFVYVF